ncbi:MAG: ATP-binding protein [Bradymonadales bacterium]|nr:ATP-binding protein [Bradymonadales bacterium]
MDHLLDIARTWSFWDRPIPPSVPRDIDLPARLHDQLCLVIQGVRRCGKSTLLQQLIGRYRLDPVHCVFLNFEDPRLSRELSYQILDELVQRFRAMHQGVERLAFFLDEIQEVEGWQRWLRTQLERPSGNLFVVTGSNAKMLSGDMSSVLTGRHLTVELYPFDIREVRQLDPTAGLLEYLDRGGFPGPLVIPDGDRLLRQYFHDIVERDIRERLMARSSQPIRQVVQMVYESAGSEMSLRRIAAASGIAVDTAAGYLSACEAAYLVLSCPFFAFSERRRASRNRKYYPVDTGLRRVVVTRTGPDRGKALECAVHLALRKRFGQVFYWRERGEVDFVLHDQGRIIPVQVTWEGAGDRHHRAMEMFYERFPQAEETVWVTAEGFESALEDLCESAG